MRVLTPTLSPTLATESATVRLFFLSALLCSVNKAACDFAHARPIMHCIHLVVTFLNLVPYIRKKYIEIRIKYLEIHVYGIQLYGTDTYTVTSGSGQCCLDLINPRRACAARVTVVVLCVCLSVCLSTTILAPRATRRLMSDTNRFSATRAGKIMWRFC